MKFHGKSLLAGALLACLSHLAGASDEVETSKKFTSCMDQTGGTTAGMVECIDAEARQQDARLNKAYKEVMAQLSAGRKKQLQEAQRAWLKFRDANCAFYYDPDGGTIARVEANDCVMASTARRARELEGFKK